MNIPRCTGRGFSSELSASLKRLAAEVAPVRQVRRRIERPKTRTLTQWEEKALVPYNPAEGMLVRQQDEWHQRLAEDPVLEWHGRLQLQKAKLKQMLEPPKSPPPVVDELPEDVVQDIFRELVEDPQEELAARRDFRRAESLALQLEHVLACPPPRLQKVLKAKVRIAKVEAADHDVVVYFECDEPKMQRRLTKAAPVVAASLARRLMIATVPTLQFVPAPRGEDGTGIALWRHQKRSRRLLVNKAVQCWAASMNW
ncbi:unnamed protein product [Effrenium voratum]|uniref:Uncharacterized protein n=1 Tax=Effrenium voratum TaxID=2562239 RepID=A0AA36HUJ7_9DINO|nr:unnamed protein product [Effrenium voratum]